MASFSKALAGVLLFGGLAGCSTPATRPAHLIPVPPSPSVNDPSLAKAPRETRGPSTPPTNPVSVPPGGRTFLPPERGPAVSESNHLAEVWIALEIWSQTNNLGAPQRLLSATNLIYQLRTTNGVITLTPGSHLAQFNGMDYWLGFAPRLAEGQVFVHTLDAEKNFLPLAAFAELPSPPNRVIVIDPGHGGENTGTRSILNNRFEKEFTLDWALRLQPLLAGNGWRVVLTRTNDTDVSLADRVAIAEQAGAALFISLHFNSAFPSQDQTGLETFCLTPTGLPSTLTRDFEDDSARNFPNNLYDTQNLQYAFCLHRALVEATGRADRGVRRARFMGVLRGQSRPAVLIEGGYLSNPQEAALIAKPDFRQKLAQAIAGALSITNDPVEQPAFVPQASPIDGEN